MRALFALTDIRAKARVPGGRLSRELPPHREGGGRRVLPADINRRHERGSTVFTSNKPYSEWGEVLGDPVIAAAILDRILHHSTTVNIKGESFRLRTRRRGGPAPQEAREVTARGK
jgi:hypothetical protein